MATIAIVLGGFAFTLIASTLHAADDRVINRDPCCFTKCSNTQVLFIIVSVSTISISIIAVMMMGRH